MTSTILSHRPTLLKTMAPLDAGGYAEGLRLTCLLTHVGPGSIELDGAELRAVLRALPTALLLEVLGERGLTLGERDVPPTGACLNCGQEASAHDAPGGLFCRRTVGGNGATYTARGDNPFLALDDPAPCEER